MHGTRTIVLSAAWILGLLALVVSAGCSVQVYSRAIDGAGPHTDPHGGSRIAILADDDDAEPDPATVDKIATLLEDQGFEITSPCLADYVMFYHYDVIDHGLGRGIEPLSGPASGIRTSHRPGPWDHSVHVRLVEARPWLQAGETRLVWAGIAEVSAAPTGGSRFLDIALVCALEDVGQASGETVAGRVRIHDRRARELR